MKKRVIGGVLLAAVIVGWPVLAKKTEIEYALSWHDQTMSTLSAIYTDADRAKHDAATFTGSPTLWATVQPAPLIQGKLHEHLNALAAYGEPLRADTQTLDPDGTALVLPVQMRTGVFTSPAFIVPQANFHTFIEPSLDSTTFSGSFAAWLEWSNDEVVWHLECGVEQDGPSATPPFAACNNRLPRPSHFVRGQFATCNVFDDPNCVPGTILVGGTIRLSTTH